MHERLYLWPLISPCRRVAVVHSHHSGAEKWQAESGGDYADEGMLRGIRANWRVWSPFLCTDKIEGE
jgi:hypothetical protein